ncbi:alpha-amylase family glycosyl hydrolase [Oceanibaculum pacificum]|uniref:Glycosyl hydrolase family 13 catalytic domain-containing protein n=1 Tax=Oceanibaculum pacificum TaxID=580166 RepID=A0A154WEN6_9PROT|nr:alpha-amylase family glycosyl hydrolase [Oceanibaculum pacificum]KZD11972.1 hypothetical protein AUP43_05720 [Oceanibaculum pacificum]
MTLQSMPLDSPNEALCQDWWRSAIIYQVYIRSFRDTNGNGIGDLKGVIEGLDYIASLGVDGVWISPFYKSPQKDFGYDIADFRVIDPLFGTMEDFMTLLDAAHKRGLKLLLDFIPCHTSTEHPWFLESRQSRDNPKADWYVWAEKSPDGTAPNNWLSSFGGTAWEWEPQRAQYFYHPFLPTQPALNLHNDEVLEHLLNEMRFWTDIGVDGFRIDAAQCLTWDRDLRSNPPIGKGDPDALIGGGPTNPFASQKHIFDRHAEGSDRVLSRFRDFADEVGCVLIGEIADIDTIASVPDFTQNGRRLHAAYDFALINCHPEVDTITAQLIRRENQLGDGWLYNVFTNHDSIRAVSNLTHFAVERFRPEAAKLLLFMQMTLKGGCIVYQGEELGLPHPNLNYDDIVDPWAKAFWPTFKGRDGARTPFPWADRPHGGFTTGKPWLRFPDEHRALNAEEQGRDDESVLSFFRAFTLWRKQQPVLQFGSEAMSRAERAPVITWRRIYAGQERRVIVNFSTDNAFLPLEPEWKPMKAPGCVKARTAHGLELGPLQFAVMESKPDIGNR